MSSYPAGNGEPLINCCRLSLHPKVFFPFLTVQWKRDQSQDKAIAQGARDGAVIMHHLRNLHPDPQAFNSAAEYLIHTSHISLTFDGYSVLCFVHWYDGKTGRYHMELFHAVAVDFEAQNVSLRALLRNLQDVAMGVRLDHIKVALDHMYTRITNTADSPMAVRDHPAKKAKTLVAKGKGKDKGKTPVERRLTPE